MDDVNVSAKFEVLLSFTRSWDNKGYLKTVANPWIRPSRSSKVIDFGTNRKRVCDFLLVRHSNLSPILHRFGYIAGFCASEWPHPYSTQISVVFPLNQITQVGSARAEVLSYSAVNLFSKFSNQYDIPQSSRTDRQTDRQTYGWTTYLLQ